MDWIKLNSDMFRDEKILLLPNDEAICIWIRLLCLAGRMENDGVFLLKEDTPYTVAQLATIMGKPKVTVKEALAMFETLGMIDVSNDVITITNWCKHQVNSDTRERYKAANRERQRRYQEKHKRVSNGVSNGISNTGITGPEKEEEKEEEIDKENIKKKSVSKRTKNVIHDYEEHHYTEEDFKDIYLDLSNPEFDLQAAGRKDGE